MHYFPCRYCTLIEGCERRKELPSKLKGLSVSSIRLVCKDYKNLFTPGNRVAVPMPSSCDGEYCCEDEEGTVIGWKDGKVRVFLDSRSGKKSPVVTFYPIKNGGETRFAINKLDEPDVELCPGCDTPVNMKRGKLKTWDGGLEDDDEYNTFQCPCYPGAEDNLPQRCLTELTPEELDRYHAGNYVFAKEDWF